jgi:hypothetical protein
VKAASPRLGTSLSHARLVYLRPGEVGVHYTAAADFHRTIVSAQSGRAQVEKTLSVQLGSPTRLVLETNAAGASPQSLAEQDAQERQQRVNSTDESVRHHPAVRAALKLLGGELEHIQVLEPEPSTKAAPSSELEVPEETG